MKFTINIGAMIIANAIVWGIIIIGCSFALKGTGCYDLIQNYLGAGATITSLIILAGSLPLIRFMKKQAPQEQPPAE